MMMMMVMVMRFTKMIYVQKRFFYSDSMFQKIDNDDDFFGI